MKTLAKQYSEIVSTLNDLRVLCNTKCGIAHHSKAQTTYIFDDDSVIEIDKFENVAIDGAINWKQ